MCVFFSYVLALEQRESVDNIVADDKKAVLSSIIVVIGLLIFIYITIKGSYLTLLIRGADKGIFSVINNQSLALIFQNLFRPLTLFLLFYHLSQEASTRKLFLYGGVALLFNSPIGTSRYYAFCVLSSFLIFYLLYYKKIAFRNFNIVYFLFLLFGTFSSSFFGIFRAWDNYLEGNYKQNNFIEYVFQGNFDAFENFALSIKMIDKIGYFYGETFLTALLFFVPRSFWVDKMEGSGAVLFENILYGGYFAGTNSNIANPLVSEFFINFGFFGIIMGSIALGILSARLDNNMKNFASKGNIFMILSWGFIGSHWLLILRGDFLSAYAYVSGAICAYLVFRYRFVIK